MKKKLSVILAVLMVMLMVAPLSASAASPPADSVLDHYDLVLHGGPPDHGWDVGNYHVFFAQADYLEYEAESTNYVYINNTKGKDTVPLPSTIDFAAPCSLLDIDMNVGQTLMYLGLQPSDITPAAFTDRKTAGTMLNINPSYTNTFVCYITQYTIRNVTVTVTDKTTGNVKLTYTGRARLPLFIAFQYWGTNSPVG